MAYGDSLGGLGRAALLALVWLGAVSAARADRLCSYTGKAQWEGRTFSVLHLVHDRAAAAGEPCPALLAVAFLPGTLDPEEGSGGAAFLSHQSRATAEELSEVTRDALGLGPGQCRVKQAERAGGDEQRALFCWHEAPAGPGPVSVEELVPYPPGEKLCRYLGRVGLGAGEKPVLHLVHSFNPEAVCPQAEQFSFEHGSLGDASAVNVLASLSTEVDYPTTESFDERHAGAAAAYGTCSADGQGGLTCWHQAFPFWQLRFPAEEQLVPMDDAPAPAQAAALRPEPVVRADAP